MFFIPVGNDRKSPCGTSCKKILKENCIQFEGGNAVKWGYDYQYPKDGSYLDRSIIHCLRTMGIPFHNYDRLITIPEDNFLMDVLGQTPLGRSQRPKIPVPPTIKIPATKPTRKEHYRAETTRLIKTPSVPKQTEPELTNKNKTDSIETYRASLLKHVRKSSVDGFSSDEYVFSSAGFLDDELLTFEACGILLSTRKLQIRCIYLPDMANSNDFIMLFHPHDYEKKVIDHKYACSDLDGSWDSFIRLSTDPSALREVTDSVMEGDAPVFQKCRGCGHETPRDSDKQCDICSGSEFEIINPKKDIPLEFVNTILNLIGLSKFQGYEYSQVGDSSNVVLQDGPCRFIFSCHSPDDYLLIVNSGMWYSTELLFWKWQGMTVGQLEKDIEAVRDANRRFEVFENKRIADDLVGKLEGKKAESEVELVAETNPDYENDRFITLIINSCRADLKVVKVEKNRVRIMFSKISDDPFVIGRVGKSFYVTMLRGGHDSFKFTFSTAWKELNDELKIINKLGTFHGKYCEWATSLHSDSSPGSITL